LPPSLILSLAASNASLVSIMPFKNGILLRPSSKAPVKPKVFFSCSNSLFILSKDDTKPLNKASCFSITPDIFL
jgi:hypothetical protein